MPEHDETLFLSRRNLILHVLDQLPLARLPHHQHVHIVARDIRDAWHEADVAPARQHVSYAERWVAEDAHPQVALCFHWKHLRQGVQVRIEGVARKLLAEESDAYFASRARGSQIGAWASLQSQTLPDRDTFEQRVARCEKEYEGRDVPRPPHWGGFVVEPDMIEFWYGAQFRLHERVRWSRHGQTWTHRLLYP